MSSEQFFGTELASHLSGEAIVSSGYFRTYLKEPGTGMGGAKAVRGFLEAAAAKGYFLALTATRLLVVVTRAPATSAPLLENNGVLSLPLEGMSVQVNRQCLVIQSPDSVLVLDAKLTHRHFPSQSALIGALSERFGTGVSVDTLRRAQRKQMGINIGLVAAIIIAGWAWATFG